MEDLEVIVNLWYTMDAEHGYVYSLSGRAYAVSGTEEEKLNVLRALAPTDYLMAKQLPVPKNYRLVSEHGEIKGIAYPQDVQAHRTTIFESIYKELEAEIPRRVQWINGKEVIERLTIPQEPLCVWTPLIEDDTGVHPRITLRPTK
jgi:hypothetical protein